SAVPMLMWRLISPGSKSEAVVPSSTRPRRSLAPESKRAASTREVLPEPPCPATATLRIESVEYRFTATSPAGRFLVSSCRFLVNRPLGHSRSGSGRPRPNRKPETINQKPLLSSFAERHTHGAQQAASLLVGPRRRVDDDVHSPKPIDLVVVDLGEDELFL